VCQLRPCPRRGDRAESSGTHEAELGVCIQRNGPSRRRRPSWRGVTRGVLLSEGSLTSIQMTTLKHPYALPFCSNHRWSGWPGAFCYYCYQHDPLELKSRGLGDGRDTTCPATDETKLNVDRVMTPSLYGFKGTCVIETWGTDAGRMN